MTQPPIGILGLNIKGQGQSADNVVAYQRRLKAHTNLVMDEPKLAAMLLSPDPDNKPHPITSRVIYRRSGDDHAHTRFPNAAAFVRALHADAPTGCYLYLGNEPGRGSLGALANWTAAALNECDRLGRKGVVFNFETSNPMPDDWRVLEYVIRQAKNGGHLLGLHAYFDRKVEDRYRAVDNTLVPLRVFGAGCPEIVITELGAAINMDPNNGYQGDISSEAYAAELVSCAAIYAQHGIACNIFMHGDWSDFGIQNDAVVTGAIASANKVYQKGIAVMEGFQHGVIAWLRSDVVNVRSGHSIYTPVVKTLRQGDHVTYRATGIKQDSYTWTEISAPVIGFVASEVCRIEPLADPPKVLLPVPYYSQLAADADDINNDCPEACTLMCIQYDRVRKGQRTMPLLTINMLVRQRADKPQVLAYITDLLVGFGVDARYARPITPDVIRKELDAGRPVIALVAYKHIFQDAFTGGHYVVFVGYSDDGFTIHDPYKAGSNFYLSNAQADKALSETAAFAAFTYQGVILV